MSVPDRFERVRESEGLSSALAVLRRRWLIVVGVVLACAAVAAAHYERAAKSYAATASVAFQSGTLSDSALGVTPAGSGEPQREADTEVLIAHSPEVAQAVRRQLRIPAGASELLGKVKVEAAANADVLNIVAVHRRSGVLDEPRERVRRTVHRLPRAVAARRHRDRPAQAPAADRRAAGRLARTGGTGAVAAAPRRAAGGRGRRGEHHRAGDALDEPRGDRPDGDRR